MTNNPVRILLVDDERNVLRSLERLFLEEEYEIHTAFSGENGLELLEHSGPFQLVISDFRMPSMNGVEFLREVRQRWPDTERMILSGYADTASIVSAINQGQICRFIAKPWNDDDLLAAVRETLERFELRARNRQLLSELMTANDELKKVNDHLNDMVNKRVKDALLKSRALHSFQNVVDALPVGFVGADGYGMIVQCNSLGADMLDVDRSNLIGKDLSSIFPLHLIQTVVQLDYNSCRKCLVQLPHAQYWAYITRIDHKDQRATVITLMENNYYPEVKQYGGVPTNRT